MSVVVVDDLAFGRTLARSLLIAAGARRVEVATDVIEGWQLICGIQPDLLILDWQLDGAPGLDLLGQVRYSNDSPNPFLPVLMTTAYREEHRVRQAISAGITSYLMKPFSPQDFLLKVKFCVNDRRSFTRTSSFFGPSIGRPELDNPMEVD